jgi:hypothetical protein
MDDATQVIGFGSDKNKFGMNDQTQILNPI